MTTEPSQNEIITQGDPPAELVSIVSKIMGLSNDELKESGTVAPKIFLGLPTGGALMIVLNSIPVADGTLANHREGRREMAELGIKSSCLTGITMG